MPKDSFAEEVAAIQGEKLLRLNASRVLEGIRDRGQTLRNAYIYWLGNKTPGHFFSFKKGLARNDLVNCLYKVGERLPDVGERLPEIM